MNKPTNPVQRGFCPKPVKPEAKTKEFEKKLERGEVETVVEGQGALVSKEVKKDEWARIRIRRRTTSRTTKTTKERTRPK